MQIPSLIDRGRSGFNMTPMIDVVFLLIIFFLVASHLSDQEAQIELELPTAESAQALEDDQQNRITFHLPNADEILHAGRPISLDRLGQLIEEAKQNRGGDVQVRIRTDRDVPYVAMTPILRACAAAGIWNVTFAVLRKRSNG